MGGGGTLHHGAVTTGGMSGGAWPDWRTPKDGSDPSGELQVLRPCFRVRVSQEVPTPQQQTLTQLRGKVGVPPLDYLNEGERTCACTSPADSGAAPEARRVTD